MKKAVLILYAELITGLCIIALGVVKGPAAVGKVLSYGWFIIRAMFGA